MTKRWKEGVFREVKVGSDEQAKKWKGEGRRVEKDGLQISEEQGGRGEEGSVSKEHRSDNRRKWLTYLFEQSEEKYPNKDLT